MSYLVEEVKRAESKTNKKETEESKENKTTFILNITENFNLQRNFLAFENCWSSTKF